MVLASNIPFYPYNINYLSHTPNSLLINNRKTPNWKLLEDSEFATGKTIVPEMENITDYLVPMKNRQITLRKKLPIFHILSDIIQGSKTLLYFYEHLQYKFSGLR